MSTLPPAPGSSPTVPTAAPTPAGRRGRGVGFWLGLVVLLGGLVVAVLGISASVASYQREQNIKTFASAYSKARYATALGTEASGTGKHLLALDDQDVSGTRELQQALLAGDAASFNAKSQSLNAGSVDQATLANRISDLVSELGKALALEGRVKTRSSSTTVPG